MNNFKSCLLRVPYTFNSKYLGEQGLDPEVKVIQQWDSSQSLPEIDNLLVEFQTLLIDRKLKAEINDQKKIPPLSPLPLPQPISCSQLAKNKFTFGISLLISLVTTMGLFSGLLPV